MPLCQISQHNVRHWCFYLILSVTVQRRCYYLRFNGGDRQQSIISTQESHVKSQRPQCPVFPITQTRKFSDCNLGYFSSNLKDLKAHPAKHLFPYWTQKMKGACQDLNKLGCSLLVIGECRDTCPGNFRCYLEPCWFLHFCGHSQAVSQEVQGSWHQSSGMLGRDPCENVHFFQSPLLALGYLRLLSFQPE